MSRNRLHFVDLMRGLAMIVMIEVHVVNSLMNPVLRNETWFMFVNFINGMVAPTFIFISGFSFMLGSQEKFDEFRKFSYPFWKQLGRIMLIWFLGYLLHIPFFSLSKCSGIATRDHWLNFMGVDVLQCIAFGLLLIFILRLIIKSDRVFLILVLLLGLGAVIPAPVIYQINFELYLPLPVAMYLTPIHNTNFPLFPWFGFMAAGVLTAWVYIKAADSGSEPILLKQVLTSGLILAAVSIPVIFLLPISDVRPNIFFFAGRFGVVYIILALCYYYSLKRDTISPMILYPSRESLVVYFMHLQILHRELWYGKSIITLSNHSLGFGTSLLISAGIILLMLPLARIWNHFKTEYRYFGRIATALMLTIGGIIFLSR